MLVLENVDRLQDKSTLIIKKGDLNSFQIGIAETGSEHEDDEEASNSISSIKRQSCVK